MKKKEVTLIGLESFTSKKGNTCTCIYVSEPLTRRDAHIECTGQKVSSILKIIGALLCCFLGTIAWSWVLAQIVEYVIANLDWIVFTIIVGNIDDIIELSGADFEYTSKCAQGKYRAIHEMIEFCNENLIDSYAELMDYAKDMKY